MLKTITFVPTELSHAQSSDNAAQSELDDLLNRGWTLLSWGWLPDEATFSYVLHKKPPFSERVRAGR